MARKALILQHLALLVSGVVMAVLVVTQAVLVDRAVGVVTVEHQAVLGQQDKDMQVATLQLWMPMGDGTREVGVVLAELLQHGYLDQEWLTQLLDLQLHTREVVLVKRRQQLQQQTQTQTVETVDTIVEMVDQELLLFATGINKY